MTTVSAGCPISHRWWAHMAPGSAAAAVAGAATVLVGAPMIGVTPPTSGTSPFRLGAYHRIQPGADPLVRNTRDALVPYRPAMCRSAMPSGHFPARRRRPLKRATRLNQVFNRHRLEAMSPRRKQNETVLFRATGHRRLRGGDRIGTDRLGRYQRAAEPGQCPTHCCSRTSRA